VQNIEIGVVWGGYGSLYVIGNVPIRQSAYDFLFDFKNCASILHRFRDIASCLSKVADFNPRHLHLAPPPYGLIPVEFRGDLWQKKTRVSVLSCDVA